MSAPEIVAGTQFLEFLSEQRLLEEPTVGCLMDRLIGKRCPSDRGVSGSTDVPPRGLDPTQKYMMRLLLFGAGETVIHRGRLCEVVETHDQLRQLHPLINEDLGEAKPSPFWVPRCPANKKEMREERIRRQYVSGLRRPFPPPHWPGESRPSGARRVQLHSNWPSTAYLTRLVKELGYNGHAAFAATTRGHLPQLQVIDRRGLRYSPQSEEFVRDSGAGIHPEHPYIQFAPNQQTTVGGGYTKTQVTAAIANHDWSDKHSTAVYEIVYMGRQPALVAASLGLKLTTVYQYCSRVRADLGAGHNFQESGADLRAKDRKSFVFSERV